MIVMMRFSLNAGPLLSRCGSERSDGGEAVTASCRDNDQTSVLGGESDVMPGKAEKDTVLRVTEWKTSFLEW